MHFPGQDVTRLAGKTVRSSYYPRTLCGVRGRDHARTRSMETTNQRLTPRPVRRTQTRLARRGANWRSSVQAFKRTISQTQVSIEKCFWYNSYSGGLVSGPRTHTLAKPYTDMPKQGRRRAGAKNNAPQGRTRRTRRTSVHAHLPASDAASNRLSTLPRPSNGLNGSPSVSSTSCGDVRCGSAIVAPR